MSPRSHHSRSPHCVPVSRLRGVPGAIRAVCTILNPIGCSSGGHPLTGSTVVSSHSSSITFDVAHIQHTVDRPWPSLPAQCLQWAQSSSSRWKPLMYGGVQTNDHDTSRMSPCTLSTTFRWVLTPRESSSDSGDFFLGHPTLPQSDPYSQSFPPSSFQDSALYDGYPRTDCRLELYALFRTPALPHFYRLILRCLILDSAAVRRVSQYLSSLDCNTCCLLACSPPHRPLWCRGSVRHHLSSDSARYVRSEAGYKAQRCRVKSEQVSNLRKSKEETWRPSNRRR